MVIVPKSHDRAELLLFKFKSIFVLYLIKGAKGSLHLVFLKPRTNWYCLTLSRKKSMHCVFMESNQLDSRRNFATSRTSPFRLKKLSEIRKTRGSYSTGKPCTNIHKKSFTKRSCKVWTHRSYTKHFDSEWGSASLPHYYSLLNPQRLFCIWKSTETKH